MTADGGGDAVCIITSLTGETGGRRSLENLVYGAVERTSLGLLWRFVVFIVVIVEKKEAGNVSDTRQVLYRYICGWKYEVAFFIKQLMKKGWEIKHIRILLLANNQL